MAVAFPDRRAVGRKEPHRLSQMSRHAWGGLDGLFNGRNLRLCAGDSRNDAENRIDVRMLKIEHATGATDVGPRKFKRN